MPKIGLQDSKFMIKLKDILIEGVDKKLVDKRRAEGTCVLCGAPAFIDPSTGKKYSRCLKHKQIKDRDNNRNYSNKLELARKFYSSPELKKAMIQRIGDKQCILCGTPLQITDRMLCRAHASVTGRLKYILPIIAQTSSQ